MRQRFRNPYAEIGELVVVGRGFLLEGLRCRAVRGARAMFQRDRTSHEERRYHEPRHGSHCPTLWQLPAELFQVILNRVGGTKAGPSSEEISSDHMEVRTPVAEVVKVVEHDPSIEAITMEAEGSRESIRFGSFIRHVVRAIARSVHTPRIHYDVPFS